MLIYMIHLPIPPKPIDFYNKKLWLSNNNSSLVNFKTNKNNVDLKFSKKKFLQDINLKLMIQKKTKSYKDMHKKKGNIPNFLWISEK